MEPTLFEGDRVTIQPISSSGAALESIKLNHVYLFQMPQEAKPIAHRCINTTPLTFQGDRQEQYENIASDKIHGEVVSLIDRRATPSADRILFGLLKNIFNLEKIGIVKNTTYLWPWEEVIFLAQKLKLLTPLCYCLLNSPLKSEIPRNIFEIIQNTLRNEALTYSSREILKAAVLDQIPNAKPIKGLYIQNIYPEPWIRNMSDLDFLVAESEYETNTNKLEKIGFKRMEPGRNYRNFNETILLDPMSNLTVEIHKKLFHNGRFLVPEAPFLSNPTWEDQYLYLAAHALTHWGSHGIHYFDLYCIVRTQKVDWNQMISKARDYQSLISLAVSLEILKEWWNWQPSIEVEIALNPLQKLSLQLIRAFYIANFKTSNFSLSKKILQILSADSWIRFFKFAVTQF